MVSREQGLVAAAARTDGKILTYPMAGRSALKQQAMGSCPYLCFVGDICRRLFKEHRKVEELRTLVAKQEAINARQQEQIEALTSGLQKVSDQLELNKTRLQLVAKE